MSRIITFGCSYTYGHGLPDCFIPPDGPGLKHSQQAWPSMLAQKLQKELLNTSYPGSSNLHILWKLFNTEFEKDDVVVILWTHFVRIFFSKLYLDSSITNWVKYENAEAHKLRLSEGENINIQNFLLIHHASLFLQKNNIKYYFLLAPHNENIDTFLEKFSIVNFFSNIKFDPIDKALDKAHPGLKSHQLLAEKIGQLILNDVVNL